MSVVFRGSHYLVLCSAEVTTECHVYRKSLLSVVFRGSHSGVSCSEEVTPECCVQRKSLLIGHSSLL